MYDSIKKIFAYFQLLTLVPALIEAVKSLESGISGPGQGPLKLKALLEIVKLIWQTVPPELAALLKFDVIEGFIIKVVGVIVGVFNESGTFKTGGQQ